MSLQKSKGSEAAAGISSVSDSSFLAQVQFMETEADDLERKVRSVFDPVCMVRCNCCRPQLMAQTETFATELADLDMRLFEVELQVRRSCNCRVCMPLPPSLVGQWWLRIHPEHGCNRPGLHSQSTICMHACTYLFTNYLTSILAWCSRSLQPAIHATKWQGSP